MLRDRYLTCVHGPRSYRARAQLHPYLHSLSPSACIPPSRSEAPNRRRHKVDSRRKAMLSKILPVELIVRATCNRPIRWRRVDGIFSRGGGDGRKTARFGAARSASSEAHGRRGPRRRQIGSAAAKLRADIGSESSDELVDGRAVKHHPAAFPTFARVQVDPLCQSSRLPGGLGTPNGGQNTAACRHIGMPPR